MSITDIGSAAAESTSGRSEAVDPEDYERMDVSDANFVKAHPGPTAVGGTAVGLRYLPGDPEQEGYDRGDVGLVIDDPFLVGDDTLSDVAVFEGNPTESDQYKILNVADKATQVLDGSGVMFDKNTYLSVEVSEDELPDQMILKLSGNAGRSAAQCLDVNGTGCADVVRNDDGLPALNENTGFPEHNGKLVEYLDAEDDDDYIPPIFSADAQLRDDVIGEEVTVMFQRLEEVKEGYEGPAYWTTVFADVEDERAQDLAGQYARGDSDDRENPDDFFGEVNGSEMLELSPTDEFERDQLTMRATAFLRGTDEGGHWPTDDEMDTLREEQGVSTNN